MIFGLTQLTPLGFGQMSLSLQGKFAPYFTLLTLPGKLIHIPIGQLSVSTCLLTSSYTFYYKVFKKDWGMT